MRPGRGPSPLVLLAAGLAVCAASRAGCADLDALAPYAGRVVTAIVLVGYESTRNSVIRREIETRAGQPLSLETIADDVQRLENLQIFAQIDLEPQPSPDDGVALTFRFKEMPAWVPLLGFSYTEQDGFSAGPKFSALNLGGRAITLGARAYFGAAKQYSARLTWPSIAAHHTTFDFYGARLSRTDTLNEFNRLFAYVSARTSVLLHPSALWFTAPIRSLPGTSSCDLPSYATTAEIPPSVSPVSTTTFSQHLLPLSRAVGRNPAHCRSLPRRGINLSCPPPRPDPAASARTSPRRRGHS